MANDANMRVSSADVLAAAKNISDKGKQIENSYKSVFSNLKLIDAAWDGEDNEEYNLRFKSFEKDFLELTSFINRVVIHLELTAKAYDTVESANTKTAQKLSF